MSPQVSEGIQVAGEPAGNSLRSERGFNAALAAQAAKGTPSAPERREAPLDPGHDTSAAIRRAVSNEDVTTDVESGLVEHGALRELNDLDPADPADRAEIRRQYEAGLEEVRRLGIDISEPPKNERTARLEQENQALRWDESMRAFEDTLDEVLDEPGEPDVAYTLATLRREAGDDAYGMALERVADEYGVDPEDDPGFFLELEEQVRNAEFRHSAIEAAKMATLREGLELTKAAKAEAADVQAKKEIVNKFARDNGLTGAQARARIEEAELAARAAGIDLPNAPLGQFEDMLRSADATAREVRSSGIERRFHEAFLSEPTSIVSEGLSYNGVPAVPRELPPQRLNFDRIARRATARPDARGDEIRAALSAPDSLAEDMRAAIAKIEKAGAKARAREARRGY